MNSPNAAPSGVFVSNLCAFKKGDFIIEVDDALRELTEKCTKLVKKGKLTVTLEIKPNGVGVGDVPLFKLKPSVSITAPKADEKEETFFVDKDNNLTRRFPGQTEISLQLVPDDERMNGAKPVTHSGAKAASAQ